MITNIAQKQGHDGNAHKTRKRQKCVCSFRDALQPRWAEFKRTLIRHKSRVSRPAGALHIFGREGGFCKYSGVGLPLMQSCTQDSKRVHISKLKTIRFVKERLQKCLLRLCETGTKRKEHIHELLMFAEFALFTLKNMGIN